ncbi:hypothetical protein ACOAMG_07545, partial [Klebsiella pneumoniae]
GRYTAWKFSPAGKIARRQRARPRNLFRWPNVPA